MLRRRPFARGGALAVALAVAWLVAGRAAAISSSTDTDGSDAFVEGTGLPKLVRICVTPYAPFIMSAMYATGNATMPGPLSLPDLNSAALVPDGVHDPRSPNFALTGFDVDYSNLVFSIILGTNVKYVVRQSYLELYLAVRAGACDVGITAAELDWRRATCDDTCDPVPPTGYDLTGEDYTMGWTPSLAAQDCCLEYGAPYFVSGFGLVSMPKLRTMNVKAAMLSPHVVNVGLTLLIMILIFSWLMQGIDHYHGAHVGAPAPSVGTTVYFAVTTMTTVGYGDVVPTSGAAQLLSGLWSIASVVGMSSLTCVVTTILTREVLSVHAINSLTDVTGPLCVEAQYPLLEEYVARAPDAPGQVVYDSIGNCMSALLDGAVEAVLGERPILSWYLATYSTPSVYMSPLLHANPLSFVFPNGSSLRELINPAVIAAQTNPMYVADSDSIATLYFGSPQRVKALEVPAAVETPLIIAAVVLTAATLALHTAQKSGLLKALQGRFSKGRFSGAEASRTDDDAAADVGAPCPADGDEGGSVRSSPGAAAQRSSAALALLAELRALSSAQSAAARAAADKADDLERRFAALLTQQRSVPARGASPTRAARVLLRAVEAAKLETAMRTERDRSPGRDSLRV